MTSAALHNLDFKRCTWDYQYYASKLLKIKDQNQQLIPFDFWSPQAKFHEVVEAARKDRKLLRFIILKARREGMSTYCEGTIFWLSHMSENTDAAIIAHEKESGEKIFGMCKLFYDCLPKELQPMVRYGSKRELSFENPDPKTRNLNPGLRSSLTVLTAGKKDVARSAGYHNLHCCLAPDTLVLTSNWGLETIDAIKVGDYVLDESGHPTLVINKFIYDNEDECVRIVLWNNSAFPIVMTSNHQLLTDNGLKYASNITMSDRLVFPILPITSTIGSIDVKELCIFKDRPQGGGLKPKKPITNNIPIGDYLGFVFGLFMAEGSYGAYSKSTGLPNRVTFSIHENEVQDVMERIRKVCTIFNFTPKPRHQNSKTVNIECENAVFARFMYSTLGYNKVPPGFFYNCGEAFVRGVVHGYLYGDSNFRTQLYNDSTSDVIKLSSVRPHLVMWLRNALLSLGCGYSGIQSMEGGIFHGRQTKPQLVLIIAGETFRNVAKILGININFAGRPHIQKWSYSKDMTQVLINIKDISYSYTPSVVNLEVANLAHQYLLGSCTSKNSELGSWTKAEDVIPALIPTVPKTLNSVIFYESTAKGVGNFFHEEWLAAKEGSSNFIPFFLAWFDLPEYVRQFNNTRERTAFIESLNSEEKELQITYVLSPEQLYWRRTTIADLRAAVELFRQEYPSNDEEAFIVSGVPLFDRRKLRTMFLKCREPKWRGNISKTGLRSDEHGNLRVWKLPETNAIYVMGIDVSGGGQYDPRSGKTKGDYSCIEVWKKLPIPLVAEQVAEWHGYVDPFNLAEIIAAVGKLYNEALASVEVESYGRVTLQELQNHYWNIYRQERIDTYDGSFTNKLGWETSLRSKKALISYGTHCISDMTIIVHSQDLVREFITFTQDESGGGSAIGGGYDDRVMATLISLYTMYRHVNQEPDDPSIIEVKKSAISVSKSFRDLEFARILEYGKDDTYDNHWLNT